MAVELQQLRYVVALAEEGSFTRAAARCFVVQSALSHQLKVLESELGVALFARTSRRVEITAAGAAFVPAARACLDAAERAAAEATAAAGRIRGRLTVGVIPTVTALDVPATLKAFHRAHPEVRIALRVAGSDELEEGIARGTVDVGLLGLPAGREPRGVAWRLLVEDVHVAVVASDHPLAGSARTGLDALARETFADFPAATPGRDQSDHAFAAAGLARHVAFEALSADHLLDLVREGLAVALLPSRFARAGAGLATVAVADGPRRAEYLAWSDFTVGPVTRAFLDAVAGAAPGT